MSDAGTGATGVPGNDAGLRAAVSQAMNTAGSAPAGDSTSTGTEPVKDLAYYQAESDKWKALSRQNEDKAKANAAAAKRLADIEEAQKTEAQKLADAKAAAEKAAADAHAELARYKVSAETGVPAELLHGSTEDELRAYAERLQTFAGQTKPANRTPDLGQGNRGPATAGDPNAWLRAAARRGNF